MPRYRMKNMGFFYKIDFIFIVICGDTTVWVFHSSFARVLSISNHLINFVQCSYGVWSIFHSSKFISETSSNYLLDRLHKKDNFTFLNILNFQILGIASSYIQLTIPKGFKQTPYSTLVFGASYYNILLC